MPINAYAAMKEKEELQKFSYDAEPLGPNDVEVNITHCGICHSDVHLIDDDFKMSAYPLVPGHEIVGTIKAKGDEVKHLDIGQRVGVGWQSGSCHTCEYCTTGQENLCSVANQPACLGKYGGFADRIITDGRFALPVPDGLESENAAAMGCEVTAFSTSPDKETEAKKLGARNFIVSKEEEQMKSAQGTLDFVISAVTVDLDWQKYMSTLRTNGRLNFVGASPGNVEVPIIDLIFGQISVSGSVIGGRAMIQEMLEFSARNNIKAKTEAVPMEKVNEAIKKVRENKARYRMVLTN